MFIARTHCYTAGINVKLIKGRRNVSLIKDMLAKIMMPPHLLYSTMHLPNNQSTQSRLVTGLMACSDSESLRSVAVIKCHCLH